ncbi:hypothetical protein L2E82_30244 [Cichorium intybus]|uniref:Uncharacterized protein n=1 Tax=Cichorium intybus TaxID=13427 RepID=A0ACB9CZU9_CICIN|nr:hypothetical protein L2E82_30244 [Cichorium intybus]
MVADSRSLGLLSPAATAFTNILEPESGWESSLNICRFFLRQVAFIFAANIVSSNCFSLNIDFWLWMHVLDNL